MSLGHASQADSRGKASSDVSGRSWWNLIKETVSNWSADKAPRLAAALAYYTIFSLPGILIISLAVAGLVFGADAARSHVNNQLHDLLGEEGAKAIDEMIAGAQHAGKGVLAT